MDVKLRKQIIVMMTLDCGHSISVSEFCRLSNNEYCETCDNRVHIFGLTISPIIERQSLARWEDRE